MTSDSEEIFDAADLDELESDPYANEPEDDGTFTSIVNEVVKENPTLLAKWMVSSPELMAKEAKQRAAREKAKKRKLDAQASGAGPAKRKLCSPPPTDETQDESRAAKRPRRAAAGDKNAGADSNTATFHLTAYIHVLTAPPAVIPTAKSRNKNSNTPGHIQKGPFRIQSTDSFATLLKLMAEALPCPVQNIPTSQITWRPQKPAKAEALLLGGETGFSALIEEFRGRKASQGFIVILTMPPPLKPAVEKPFWETNDGESQGEPEFDFSELEPKNSHNSLTEQRATLDKAVAPIRSQLEEKYPNDNNPLFPGKRVYTNSEGVHWELSEIRLSIWAAHIARGNATLTQPPPSSHFEYKTRLHAPVPIAHGGNMGSSMPIPPQTTPIIQAPVASMPSLIEILTAFTVVQQQNNLGRPQQPMIMAQPPTPTPTLSLSAPPSPAKHRTVSLDEFCQYYQLPAIDIDRLGKLEYQPGDRGIEKLERADWKDDAGFSKLGWEKVLLAHRHFLQDARLGKWS